MYIKNEMFGPLILKKKKIVKYIRHITLTASKSEYNEIVKAINSFIVTIQQKNIIINLKKSLFLTFQDERRVLQQETLRRKIRIEQN